MTNAETQQSASEAAAPTLKAAATPEPTAGAVAEEQIRMRAYEFYCDRGRNGGDAISDWLRAEREQREVGLDAGDAKRTADMPRLVGTR
jgi:hypothetical protein